MSKVSELRDRLVELDDIICMCSPDDWDYLVEKRDALEAEYFDAIEEELDCLTAMERGFERW